VKFSNFGEIFLWFISIIVYFSGQQTYFLVWLHLAHVFRGILGIVISNRLPRSYELIEQIDVNQDAMETKLYNQVIRDAVYRNVVPRLSALKCFLLGYFALTFVNFIFDVIDLLYILSGMNSNNQLDTVVFLIIVFVYIVIDLAYLLWSNFLKYSYSPDMLSPISEAFSGVMSKLKSRLKLTKKQQNQAAEEEVQEIQRASPNNSPNKNIVEYNNNNAKFEVNLKEMKSTNAGEKKEYDSIEIDFHQNQQKNY